jgi:hypothetical protein
MFPLLTTCPVCGGPFHAERLACNRCHATLEGRFSLDWLGRLNREQLEFVRLLVKNRGNINGVASELKIAYNTARSRLDDIVAALGYGPPPPPPVERPERRAILNRLQDGELTVEEAMELLRR